MAIELSLDLSQATLADLQTFIQAVEATGTLGSTELHLEGATLRIAANPTNPNKTAHSTNTAHSARKPSSDRGFQADGQSLQWLLDRVLEVRNSVNNPPH
ncbi:hypothetical protein NQ024_01140 [Corynebacterium sp. 35RC1]|nr:hypothetical protein [Corynebacterium sp. 35RC1]